MYLWFISDQLGIMHFEFLGKYNAFECSPILTWIRILLILNFCHNVPPSTVDIFYFNRFASIYIAITCCSETLCGPAWPEVVTRVTITFLTWHQVCSDGQPQWGRESQGSVPAPGGCIVTSWPVSLAEGQPRSAGQQLSWVRRLSCPERQCTAHPHNHL